ncbi:ABC transporter permease [Geomesophilobacter sediminis]|uniref:FtsX-like permease family protein n=1 Tax=Geomesophilobacter sediminis TaxID=2798584 RepID=A0A8J7LU90_9BACT|nr:FtsX-like permease family protein [Geomesophilobacter sediminis]MBJ6724379.1 FtsX-like permease family protein [Geomesophilobacter sediminis]
MARGLDRQRHILDFTLAALLRRKGKTGALVAVYTLVVFLLASALFFGHALRREAELVLKDAPEITVQRSLTGRYAPIPKEYAGAIGEIRGVSSARPRLWGYYYDANSRANYTLVVPAENQPDPGTIVIGSGIATLRDANPGDQIGFTGYDGAAQSYRVARVLPEGAGLVSADLILISERDYRALSGIPDGEATDLVLTVHNAKEFATVAEKIRQRFPDTRPIVRDEILRTYDALFNWRGGVVAVLSGMAGLAFVIFAWDKATGLSAEERKEIGVLKAVGWETSDILAMKFWEGIAVSFTAFLLGVTLGYLHVFWGGSFLFAPVLKGWSTLYPNFRLIPAVDFGELGAILFLVVVPYSVSTIVPSWRAATIDPDAVLR